MRALTICTLLLTLSSFHCFGQADSLANKIRRTRFNYTAFTYDENRVYAINGGGQVVVWDLSTLDTVTNQVIDEGALFVGPGAYNKTDRSIYFATSRGIHKIKADHDTSTNAELVANPQLRWGREPLAIGVAMNITKMEFLPDGRLIFLTAMDGIGILSEGKISLLY